MLIPEDKKKNQERIKTLIEKVKAYSKMIKRSNPKDKLTFELVLKDDTPA